MKKGNTIKVIIKHPGCIPYINWIPNELSALQDIVGGYIEVVNLTSDVCIICNEEGKLLDLDPNVKICGELFVGTIIIAGVDGEDFANVPATWSTMRTAMPFLFQSEVVV